MIIQGDALEELKKLKENSVDSIVTDPPAGISFMGKDWDSHKGGRNEWIDWLTEVMEESLRVLKPGGHALVWALPRTSHWTATALENAGFEIRDCIYHIFGSGFPKSLNIGKAIDKLQGNEREFVSENPANRPYNLTKGETSTGWKSPPRPDKDKGTSEWEGWGTALKPAVECWWLVRKPLSESTIAGNVLKWGVGGLNIDESRIETEDKLNREIYQTQSWKNTSKKGVGSVTDDHLKGRFPSHLILDEEAGQLLDEQSGELKSGSMKKSYKYTNDGYSLGKPVGSTKQIHEANQGGASRFFYCAKPSKAERNMGCEGMDEKKVSDGREIEADNAFQRGKTMRSNTHPTVKSLSLMTYLIRLITPPEGIVLDMFVGSGSTLIAAQQLGHKFIGIEKEKEYVKIAEARIKSIPKKLL